MARISCLCKEEEEEKEKEEERRGIQVTTVHCLLPTKILSCCNDHIRSAFSP
jgi:hypothetical protein